MTREAPGAALRLDRRLLLALLGSGGVSLALSGCNTASGPGFGSEQAAAPVP